MDLEIMAFVRFPDVVEEWGFDEAAVQPPLKLCLTAVHS